MGECVPRTMCHVPQVKVKSALDNVLEERNVLTMMKSNFVTNLKYALQDEENLYLMYVHMCTRAREGWAWRTRVVMRTPDVVDDSVRMRIIMKTRWR